VQNAWISPGTALPFFAAAGWVWCRPASPRAPESAGARAITGAAILAAMAVLFALALPRAQSQWLVRSFYVQSAEDGIDAASFDTLVEAADADPGDLDAQRLLLGYGEQILGLSVPWAARAEAPVRRARERIAELAPHAP
jgi:hypothetical protein